MAKDALSDILAFDRARKEKQLSAYNARKAADPVGTTLDEIFAARAQKRYEEHPLLSPFAAIAGGISEAPETIARAARAYGGIALKAPTTDIIESTKAYRESSPWLAQAPGEGAISQGIRSFAHSLTAGIGGAAIGAVAGGGVPGAAAGFALGGGGVFGGAEYDRFMEEAEPFIKSGEITREQAREAAMWSGVAEGGLEGVANLFEFFTAGGGRVLTAPAKQMAKHAVRDIFKQGFSKTAKRLAVTQGKMTGAELATELPTAYYQNELRRNLGMSDVRTLDAVIGAIGPTIVASAIFGGMANITHSLRRSHIRKSLANPDAPLESRLNAVGEVYDTVNEVDPEIANVWLKSAYDSIARGESISEEQEMETPWTEAIPDTPGSEILTNYNNWRESLVGIKSQIETQIEKERKSLDIVNKGKNIDSLENQKQIVDNLLTEYQEQYEVGYINKLAARRELAETSVKKREERTPTGRPIREERVRPVDEEEAVFEKWSKQPIDEQKQRRAETLRKVFGVGTERTETEKEVALLRKWGKQPIDEEKARRVATLKKSFELSRQRKREAFENKLKKNLEEINQTSEESRDQERGEQQDMLVQPRREPEVKQAVSEQRLGEGPTEAERGAGELLQEPEKIEEVVSQPPKQKFDKKVQPKQSVKQAQPIKQTYDSFKTPDEARAFTTTNPDTGKSRTVKELRQIAKGLGVPIGNNIKKADIVNKIITHKPFVQKQQSPEQLQQTILDKMVEVEPRASDRALVSIRKLRKAVGADKNSFDQAMIRLGKEGKIALHYHDYPASLNEQEKAEMVRDSRGNYYIGAVYKEGYIKEREGKKSSKDKIHQAYDKVARGKRFVNIYEIRRESGLGKDEFDTAFSQLNEKREIVANLGNPADLTHDQIDDSYKDDYGDLYITATKRSGIDFHTTKKQKTKGLKVHQARNAISPIINNWKNKPKGGIHVVETFDDLPENVYKTALSNIKKRGGLAKHVKAMRMPDGAVYIISNKFDTPQEAVNALLHEVVGHDGIKVVLGNNYKRFMGSLYYAKIKEVREVAKQKKIDLDTPENRIYATDEWFALKVGNNEITDTIWKKLARYVNEWLRKIGIDVKLSDSDISGLVTEAYRYYEKGETSFQFTTPTDLSTDFMTTEGSINDEEIHIIQTENKEKFIKSIDQSQNLSKAEKLLYKTVRNILPDSFFKDLEIHVGPTGNVALNETYDMGDYNYFKSMSDVINLYKGRDITVFLHELGHRQLIRLLNDNEIFHAIGTYKATKYYNEYQKALKSKDSYEQYWNSFEEWFADSFRNYVIKQIKEGGNSTLIKRLETDGITYNKSAIGQLDGLFNRILSFLKSVWNEVRGKINTTKEMNKFFDDLFYDTFKNVDQERYRTNWAPVHNLMKTGGVYKKTKQRKPFDLFQRIFPRKEVSPYQANRNKFIHSNDKTWAEWIDEKIDKITGDNLSTNIFDRLAPIKQKVGETSYKHFRIIAGWANMFEGVLKYGRIVWDGDRPRVQKDKGLEGIFREVREKGGDPHLVFDYILGRDAQSRKDPGWTAENHKVVMDEVNRQGGEKIYRDAAAEVKKLNDSIVELGVKSGLFEREQANKWLEKQFYVPLYRMFRDEMTGNPFIGYARSIKKYKGSERMYGDPLDNMMNNWMWIVQRANQNIATKDAVELAKSEKLGVIKELTNSEIRWHVADKEGKILGTFKAEEDANKFADKQEDYASVTPAPEGTVNTANLFQIKKRNVHFFKRDGKTVFFEVYDEGLLNAMLDINAPVMNGVLRWVAQKPKRLLTYGVTANPLFKIRNFIRDMLNVALVHPEFKPWRAFGGIIKVIRKDQDYISFLTGGGGQSGSYMNANNPELAADLMRRIRSKEGDGAIKRVIDSPRKFKEFWDFLGEISEQAVRVQLYADLKKKGYSHFDAVYEARDLLDFSMSGAHSATRLLVQTLPFFGARMSGMYKLLRAGKRDIDVFKGLIHDRDISNIDWWKKLGGTVYARGALLTIVSIYLWAKFKDDEKYKGLEDWDKASYYHLWLTDSEKSHIRIPKPFELGAVFSTLPVAALESIYAKEGKIFGDAVVKFFSDTLEINPVPQIIKPGYEIWANKDMFTGRPVVGPTIEGLLPGEQADPWTSESLKTIGKATGYSPKKIEKLLRGYTGWMITGPLSIVDFFLAETDAFPDRPAFEWRKEIPTHSKHYTEFYDLYKEVDQLAKTVAHYRKTGEFEKAQKLVAEKADKLSLRKRLNKIRLQSSAISRKIKSTYTSRDLTPDEKRNRINELKRKQNELMKMGAEIKGAL